FRDDWFYPGDLGVLDGKGRLALFGRTTDILHIEGGKVAAEPIERALRDRLGCDVCLITGPGEGLVEELHVFVEARRPISQAELTEAAQACLWGFPRAHFHRIDALPRTGLGKVSRIALARRFHTDAMSAAGAAAAS